MLTGSPSLEKFLAAFDWVLTEIKKVEIMKDLDLPDDSPESSRPRNAPMILDPDDLEQFFKLHKALMLFVNQRLKIVKPPAKSEKVIVALPPDDRLKVRDAFVENLDLIDAFVEENPYKLDQDELGIVRSWKDLVAGEFYVLRFLKKYTVFLTAKEPTVAYGVVGLSEPLDEVIEQPLPFYCKTVLLPFQDRIVYDGVLSGQNLIIGSNMTRGLNETYNDAKKRHGIVTSLPWRAESPKALPMRGIVQKERGKRGSGLIGKWRITWMETWKPDYVDDEVEGFFRFDPDETGKFQFYCVKGVIDYREVKRDGKPAVEFSWDGLDAKWSLPQGRGWGFWTEIRWKAWSSSTLTSTLRSGLSGRGVKA